MAFVSLVFRFVPKPEQEMHHVAPGGASMMQP